MPKEKPERVKYPWGAAWFMNGKLHREDGPAVHWRYTYKSWYKYGKLHREDGPAIEWYDDSKAWYLNDINYYKQEYFEELEKPRGKEHTDRIRLIYA